jgi:hypothetical protein
MFWPTITTFKEEVTPMSKVLKQQKFHDTYEYM